MNGVSSNLTMACATRVDVADAIDRINEQGSKHWFLWLAFMRHIRPSMGRRMRCTAMTCLRGTEDDIKANSRPCFEAMIEAMDFQIGRLLNIIDTNDTSIIFIGDNGTAATTIQPPYDIAPRAKDSLFEGETHEPLIIAGPDVVAGGRTSDAVVHCADLFATTIELAGGTPPATGTDARSLFPFLQNKEFNPAQDYILVESDNLKVSTTGYGRAIRNSQYKLIEIDG